MAKLTKKLHIKAGQTGLIINPPSDFEEMVGGYPEGFTPVEVGATGVDFVMLFVLDKADLHSLGPKAILAIKHDGILWFAYPKRGSGMETDISGDVGWDVITAAGLRGIAQISLNATWSALRFRPVDKVKKK